VRAIASCDAEEIDEAVRALAAVGFGIDLPAERFEAWEVVVKQHAVEVGNIDPQPATLAALAKRQIVLFLEIDHFDAAAGAIHFDVQLL
jgi:hypothetical protein